MSVVEIKENIMYCIYMNNIYEICNIYTTVIALKKMKGCVTFNLMSNHLATLH